MQISSFQNKRIKNLVKLRQRRHRENQQLTVVEGLREVSLALERQIVPTEAYFCPALASDDQQTALLAAFEALASQGRTDCFEVTPEIYAKIAYRGESGGLLLVVPYFHCSLDALPIRQPAFLAVIENIEKPGNLGAILRTSDAAGVDGVIVCSDAPGAGTDVHNPNVIRASLGALFTVPVAVGSSAEVIDWLRGKGIRMVAATPAAAALYTEVDMTSSVALVLGSESDGLTDTWLSAADEQVLIPMQGTVDSLNLAVSTALLLYECVRQRAG